MHVSALYRYPIKGFTREACTSLTVLPGGRIAGDRVFALRFADVATPDDAWGPKFDCVALVHTPGLAQLAIAFDDSAQRLRVTHADRILFDGALDATGRSRFAEVIGAFVQSLPESPLASGKHALPLRVVGDGVTPRYQDREPGYTTLHGRASVAALAAAIGEEPALSDARFRSNVVIDGVDAWEEQQWIGRKLRVGDVVYDVAAPVTRCLATHANPATGERDRAVMPTLLRVFASERPTLAVLMTSERGGSIRVGDVVEPVA
ncbi:MAG: MOSC domain-containing protein [Proteobacteria bacterium]|nr:MOSC domain-containing protein [Pseudomonadota bacterium]